MHDQIIVEDLKIIKNVKGDILHVLKSNEKSFDGFGEAYFSSIKYMQIKAWKRHKMMTLNLVVPYGKVRFVCYDDRGPDPYFSEFTMSKKNYKRITIPPMIWFGFQGLSKDYSLVLNLANVLHDPKEADNIEMEKIEFKWE